jgi:hypothetical protein
MEIKMSCPNCNTEFNINDHDSAHQVNDLTNLTYCSCECSEEHMFKPETVAILANHYQNTTLPPKEEIIEDISTETFNKTNAQIEQLAIRVLENSSKEGTELFHSTKSSCLLKHSLPTTNNIALHFPIYMESNKIDFQNLSLEKKEYELHQYLTHELGLGLFSNIENETTIAFSFNISGKDHKVLFDLNKPITPQIENLIDQFERTTTS